MPRSSSPPRRLAEQCYIGVNSIGLLDELVTFHRAL